MTEATVEVEVAKVPPLHCGDLFIVDNGRSLGITVKHMKHQTFEQILKAWNEGESEKNFPFEDHETLTFFNGKGAYALEQWLQTRQRS